MSRRTGLFAISLLVLAVLGLSLFIAAQAFTKGIAQPAQSDQTLQALVIEVHQLRMAIQRANLNTYYAQITTERIKLQQQRVDRLTAQLGEAPSGCGWYRGLHLGKRIHSPRNGRGDI